jgi:hypothetical protein
LSFPPARQGTFSAEVWAQVRPNAISQAVEIENLFLLWASVLIAHLMTMLAAAIGFDPDFVKYVSFMERWTWRATFAAFFFGVWIRLYRTLRVGTR